MSIIKKIHVEKTDEKNIEKINKIIKDNLEYELKDPGDNNLFSNIKKFKNVLFLIPDIFNINLFIVDNKLEVTCYGSFNNGRENIFVDEDITTFLIPKNENIIYNKLIMHKLKNGTFVFNCKNPL